MKLHDVGEIIATRRLELANQEKEVVVLIGKPTRFPDSNDFFTPYQILGVGRDDVQYAGGVDAVQSLQLVMKMIGNYLVAENQRLDDSISWDAGDNGDLGFPTSEY